MELVCVGFREKYGVGSAAGFLCGAKYFYPRGGEGGIGTDEEWQEDALCVVQNAQKSTGVFVQYFFALLLTTCVNGDIIRIQFRNAAAWRLSFCAKKNKCSYLGSLKKKRSAFVKDEKKRRFLETFARDYDLSRAAASAKIGRLEAYRILKESKDELDRLISERLSGDSLAAIRREYERVAFDNTGEEKTADRIRALEVLRMMASADRAEGGAPPLVIHCEYV